MTQNIQPSWLIIFSLLAAILPMLVCTLSSYLRISIVLSIFKNAFGVPQFPSLILISSFSILLTYCSMEQEISKTYSNILTLNIDYSKSPNSLQLQEIKKVIHPFIDFMEKHIDPTSCGLLKLKIKNSISNPSVEMLCFLTSELKIAFKIGLFLLIPFALIDLFLAFILSCLGMYTVSVAILSLPLKLLLFVLADGWTLLTIGLLDSFNV